MTLVEKKVWLLGESFVKDDWMFRKGITRQLAYFDYEEYEFKQRLFQANLVK